MDRVIIESETRQTIVEEIDGATRVIAGENAMEAARQARLAADSKTEIDAIIAAAQEAIETSVDAAAVYAGEIGPLIVAPDVDSALIKLLRVEFMTHAAGVDLAIPELITVREFANDALDRFRFRIAGFDGVATYTNLTMENPIGDGGGGFNMGSAGFGGLTRVDLYADGVALGVPNGTLVGYAWVLFDGVFGTYYPFTTFPYGEGGLQRDRTVPNLVWTTNVEAVLDDRMAERGTLFRADATDDVLPRFLKDAVIGGLDPDDEPFWNYEMSLQAGPEYRVKLHLHSTKLGGAVVAIREIDQATDPALDHGSTLHLTNCAAGGMLPGDVGATALVVVDWDGITLGASALTAYVDAGATGIRPGKIVAVAETRQRWLAPAMPSPAANVMAVGPTGDFPTLTGAGSAWEYIEGPDFAPYSRATYPGTDLFMPERPLIVRCIEPGYDEQIVPFTADDVDQSPLRLHHGLILHLPIQDQLIYMDAPGYGAPVAEMLFTAAIIGLGQIEQRQGNAYTLHIDDGNAATVPYARQITTVIHGVTLRRLVSDASPVVGLGLSQDGYLFFDAARLERGANAANGPFIGGHNSPGDVAPGVIHLRNVTSDIAGAAQMLSMNYSQPGTAKHIVIVENSDCPRVTFANSYGLGGGWVRRFPLGAMVVTGTLDV